VLPSGIVVGAAGPANAVPTTASAAVGTAAPVLSYTFDSDSGNAVVDSSGNSNNGSWSGTPAYVDGVSGKAAKVSASADSAGSANFVKFPQIAGKHAGHPTTPCRSAERDRREQCHNLRGR
jgi:hypothetical protein